MKKNYNRVRTQLEQYIAPAHTRLLIPAKKGIPTYQFENQETVLLDVIFSPLMSQKIIRFIEGKFWTQFIQIISMIGFLTLLFVLFGVLPKKCSYLYLIVPLIGCTTVWATTNVQIFFLLITSWNFWYFTSMGVIFAIEFCLLFPDDRMIFGICTAITVFNFSCSDTWSVKFRGPILPAFITYDLFLMLLLAGIHFNLFPDIVDTKIRFYAIEWQVRQMLESTLSVMILWHLRYTYYIFRFPRDLVFLTMKLRRA